MSLHFTIITPYAWKSNTVTDAGRDVHALEQVEVHAAVVRDRRLDRIGVTHDDDRLVRVRGDDVVERGDHARLHLGDRLAVREAGPGRRDLHDLPLVGLGEVGDLAAGPVAVVGFDHARAAAALRARDARRCCCAVCVVRSIGLAYTAAIGSFASRCAVASAWPTPFSERSMPGMRPESSGPVCAVTACRTSTSRVGGFGLSGDRVGRLSAGASVCGRRLGLGHGRQVTGRNPVRSLAMTDVHLSPTGPPETDSRPRARRRARRAAGRARAGRRPPRRRRRRLRALAALPRRVGAARRLGRDDVEAYAYFRVGYHRGLDRLRQSGWRGSGYVRWRHETNRGFLRALDGLRSAAEAIGEPDEAQRCAEFLRQLDPDYTPGRE